jgi:choline dehydrogenase-like flavoprotein
LAITSNEKRSLVRLYDILNDHLRKLGVGYIVSNNPSVDSDWPALTDSSHHMGTTRISQNPKMGVVDENCKVHEISNLYISSSSVFPTGGHVNPTLTIIALALRLANHLKSIVLPTL